MTLTIGTRNADPEDEEFLFEVYRATRIAEITQFGWDAERSHEFLRMQFNARQHAYKMQFPSAEHSIILFGETASGRLIVARSAINILLVDITVLPQYRRQGIATHLLRELQDESKASQLPLILHVDKTNQQSFEWYLTLGFTVSTDTQLMYELIWKPRQI